jgi:hypothetical protein
MDGDNNNPKPDGNNNDQGNSSMANDFANESNLAPSQDGAKPQMSERMKGGVKNAAVNSSETAQKVKKTVDDAKKVADPSMSSNKMAKEELENAEGIGGKADAAARVATGKAASKAAVAATGGAAAPLQGAIEKGTMVLTRPENRKKVLLVGGIILMLPALIIAGIAGVIFYAAANPADFVQKVLTSPKAQEFTAQAAAIVPNAVLGHEKTLKQYGYVENRPGTAFAQTNAPKPKPGSLEEKVTKINFKNAKYQSTAGPDCPYKFTYKEMVGPQGSTSTIDKVYDRNGKEVAKEGFLFDFCLMQSMPLYNMMVRTQNARDINKYSKTILNYADAKDSPNIKGKTPQEVQAYVYDKTYNRVTSKTDNTPKVEGYASLNKDPANGGIDKYIQDVRKALENKQDPSNIQFPIRDAGTPDSTAKTLCAFSDGYLTQQNIKKAIGSRINSGQRSGVKWNTISSTRELGEVSNAEIGASFKQLDGWTGSTAYSQNVYGTLKGEDINPESIGNATYGANYTETISLLINLKKKCGDVKSANSFWGSFLNLFGFGESEDEAKQAVLNTYAALQDLIIRDSNGKFKQRKDFGLEQLIIGVVRMGGGSAVSGLEPGTQNFNNQSQGYRAIANQYMMIMGGQFLTQEEAQKLSMLTENTRVQVEKKNGIAYRLFNKDNLRSLANVIQFESPRTPNEFKNKAKEYIASISNPVKMIADIQSGIGYIATGSRSTAFAAGETGDAYMKLNTVGIPEDSIKNTDIYAVSNEIQNLKENGTEQQKQVLGYFDKCSKANIPTANYFIRGYPADNNAKLNLSDPYDLEIDGVDDKVNVPVYPAAGEDDENKNGNFSELGFSDRKEMIACELYLLPNRAETKRDLGAGVQKKLFGIEISDLSRKYHIYLYANNLVDLMVELSSTEKTDKIYANGTANESAPTATADLNSPCPSGTTFKEKGVDKDKSGNITNQFNVCIIDGTSIDVSVKIATQIRQLVDDAKKEGINFNGGGYRSIDEQISLRSRNGCPDIWNAPASSCGTPTAIPGSSMHEKGEAIDFQEGGSTLTSGSTGFNWLVQNASRYGLKNLPSEAWHWSTTGG